MEQQKNGTMGTARHIPGHRHNGPAADQTSEQVISFYALAVTFQPIPLLTLLPWNLHGYWQLQIYASTIAVNNNTTAFGLHM